MELVDKVRTKMSYRRVLQELVEKVQVRMAFKKHGEVVVLFDGFVIPRIVVPDDNDDISEDESMPGLLPPELDDDSDDDSMPSLIPRVVREDAEDSDDDLSMPSLIPRNNFANGQINKG